MVRAWKFRIQVVEGFYYPCSENKGADQLRGYREADLRLCFRICKKRFSHNEAPFIMLSLFQSWPYVPRLRELKLPHDRSPGDGKSASGSFREGTVFPCHMLSKHIV